MLWKFRIAKIVLFQGGRGSHLEILQTTTPPKQQVRLSRDLMGGIGMTWRFRIAKSFKFH